MRYITTCVHFASDSEDLCFENPILSSIYRRIYGFLKSGKFENFNALLAALDGETILVRDLDKDCTITLSWDPAEHILRVKEHAGIECFVDGNRLKLIDRLVEAGQSRGRDEIWISPDDLEDRFQQMRMDLLNALTARCYRIAVEAGSYVIGPITDKIEVQTNDVLLKDDARWLIESIIAELEDFEDDHFYQPYPVIRGSCVVMSHNDFSWSVENGVLLIQIRYIPNKPRFCEYTESLTLHPTDEEPTTCIAYLDEDEEDEDWDDDEQEED